MHKDTEKFPTKYSKFSSELETRVSVLGKIGEHINNMDQSLEFNQSYKSGSTAVHRVGVVGISFATKV